MAEAAGSERSSPAETVTFVSRVVIDGKIEDVWREITRTDAVQQCMFNTRMRTRGLEVGAKVAWDSKSGKYTGSFGEVLELDPPRRFVHSFRFTQFDDPPCKVIHELTEVEGGVEYSITSTDVPEGSRTAKQMKMGGGMIARTLKTVVETGRPGFGTRVLYRLFGLLEFTTPSRCLVESWPVD